MNSMLCDFLFIGGLACVVAGGWMHSTSGGLAATGVAACVAGWVVKYFEQRQRRRGR